MGYRKMKTGDLFEIWTRLDKGYSRRRIARDLGLDRKTVDAYAGIIQGLDIPSGTCYAAAASLLSAGCKSNGKPSPCQDVFTPLLEEIRSLLDGSAEDHRLPMKGTTVWAALVAKYNLDRKTSYPSLVRFIRYHRLRKPASGPVPRIEVGWGQELQIDYAKMGTWLAGDRRRVIYAFIAVLSASRLPFVLFTTSQDQVGFALAVIQALNFYGGAPTRFNLDNLKAGILKADIHDPVLNLTFAELCDHYGVLADPARVRHPKDKAKIERFVQVAREVWKLLSYLYPQATLEDLNDLAVQWCRNEYGGRKHGTTGQKPWEAFLSQECAVLRPLPDSPYVPARWDHPVVHPDQFIMVNRRLYGLPATMIGKKVSVRSTSTLVDIYFEHKLIRTYIIPAAGKRAYLPEDFPPYARPFEQGSHAAWLVRTAEAISPQAGHYISLMLETSGNLGIRRAHGCLDILDSKKSTQGFSHVVGQAIARKVFIPARLKILFSAEACQNLIPFPLSERGKAMGREAGYYTGP